MAFRLAPEALAAGYGLVAHETIGSTSTDAMERLRSGGQAPLWVVSSHQTQGRGRRGSAWDTQPGNLAASLALMTTTQPAVVATLGFVAGVALVRALGRVAGSSEGRADTLPRTLSPAGRGQGEGAQPSPGSVAPPHPNPLPAGERERVAHPFRLKWPNDVLAGGSKLSGILLETETAGEARAVVVGIGVNVLHAPEGLPYPTASLRALGHAVTAEELFLALSAEWMSAIRLWDEGRGFGAVRDLWLARAAGIGGPVSVNSGGGVVLGRFETIDEQGQLVLRTNAGEIRTISAGEVHFGSAASARQEAAA